MPDRREPERRPADFSLEQALWAEGFRRVAGVDEAGRGPLAGPVVVAAVILPREWPGSVALDDSKRMTPAAREKAFGEIRRRAECYRIVVVSHATIDRINILRATLLGMAQAVAGLQVPADCVLVDGNQAPETQAPCRTVVGGDGKSLSIAAASVLAKVVRDRLMAVYDRRYPGWGFAGHKGYPTAAHREAVRRLGPSPIHRLTFGEVKRGTAQRPAAADGESPWRSGTAEEKREAADPRASGRIPDAGTQAGSARTTPPGIWSAAATGSASGTGAARQVRLI